MVEKNCIGAAAYLLVFVARHAAESRRNLCRAVPDIVLDAPSGTGRAAGGFYRVAIWAGIVCVTGCRRLPDRSLGQTAYDANELVRYPRSSHAPEQFFGIWGDCVHDPAPRCAHRS